jgi:hypothetical protein
MANLNKSTAEKSLSFSGAFGSASQVVFEYTAAAAQVNDVIYLGKLPKYATVTGVTLYNAALGGSSTVDVGYATAELEGTLTADDNYWISAQATHAEAITLHSALATAKPKKFTEEIFVTATVEGAAATGKIFVVVNFLHTNG